MMEAVAVKRIAVLGAGTIGGSWVSWFLARGMQVTVWDPRAEAADFVRRYVADAWPAMARLGMTADASPDAPPQGAQRSGSGGLWFQRNHL